MLSVKLLKMQNCSSTLALPTYGTAPDEISDNNSNDSEVLEACKNGNMNILKKIVTRTNANAQETEGSRSYALHCAAGFGRFKVVEYLLTFGADVHSRDVGGFIPLHNASMFGHVDVVRLLIKHKSNINAVDNWGQTPLHEAAWKGKVDVCIVLLQLGAKFDMKNVDGKTALDLAVSDAKLVLTGEYRKDEIFLASSRGQTKELEMFLTPLNVNCVTGDEKVSLLHLSAFGCHTGAVKILLNNGANVNLMDKRGATPLFHACRQSHYNVVQQLIKGEAYVNATDTNGSTPLHEAVLASCASVCSLLLCHGANPTIANMQGQSAIDLSPNQDIHDLLVNEFKGYCLMKAVARCNLAWIRKYLSSVTVAFQHPVTGDTPLHTAVSSTHPNRREVVEFLIANGVDLHMRNKQYLTPLHVAAGEAHHDAMLELLIHGAKVDAIDSHNRTALHHSVHRNDIQACKILMEYGANPCHVSRRGVTPFELASSAAKAILNQSGTEKNRVSFEFIQACKTGDLNYVQGVLEDLPQMATWRDQYSKNGMALHVAARFNNVPIAELLLCHNADINARDNRGWTPLHSACAHGSYLSAEFLIKNGADVNTATTDISETSPLHDAARRGYAIIVRLLLQAGADRKQINKLNQTPLDYVAGVREDIAAMLRMDDTQIENLKREWSKGKTLDSFPAVKPLPNRDTQCPSSAVSLAPPPQSGFVCRASSSSSGLNDLPTPKPNVFLPRPLQSAFSHRPPPVALVPPSPARSAPPTVTAQRMLFAATTAVYTTPEGLTSAGIPLKKNPPTPLVTSAVTGDGDASMPKHRTEAARLRRARQRKKSRITPGKTSYIKDKLRRENFYAKKMLKAIEANAETPPTESSHLHG